MWFGLFFCVAQSQFAQHHIDVGVFAILHPLCAAVLGTPQYEYMKITPKNIHQPRLRRRFEDFIFSPDDACRLQMLLRAERD